MMHFIPKRIAFQILPAPFTIGGEVDEGVRMNERVWSFRRGLRKGSWRFGGQREADLENSLYLSVN